MQTSLIQSQLHRNAAVIRALTIKAYTVRAEAGIAQLSASRKQLRASVAKMLGTINKLADIQRGLKRDLLAKKFAKATVYKKHGKDDPRYAAWLEGKQAAERSAENYTPVEFFPPAIESVSCGC